MSGYGWKFLDERDGRIVSKWDGSEWTMLPDGRSEWREVAPPTELCKAFNDSPTITDAWGYVRGTLLARTEHKGDNTKITNKTTSEKMRLLKVWRCEDFDAATAAAERDYDAATAPAQRDFEAATAAAQRDFEAARAAAERDYDAATAPAQRDFEAATAAARRVYDAATAPAWRDLRAATAAARRVYDAATAAARRVYDAATAPAQRDYDAAIQAIICVSEREWAEEEER